MALVIRNVSHATLLAVTKISAKLLWGQCHILEYFHTLPQTWIDNWDIDYSFFLLISEVLSGLLSVSMAIPVYPVD